MDRLTAAEFEDLLLDYSQWLDRHGYVRSGRGYLQPVNEEYHQDLVRDFVATKNAQKERNDQR